MMISPTAIHPPFRSATSYQCGARSAECGVPAPPRYRGGAGTPHSALRAPHWYDVADRKGGWMAVGEIIIYEPAGVPDTKERRLAPRPRDLRGKVVGVRVDRTWMSFDL